MAEDLDVFSSEFDIIYDDDTVELPKSKLCIIVNNILKLMCVAFLKQAVLYFGLKQ